MRSACAMRSALTDKQKPILSQTILSTKSTIAPEFKQWLWSGNNNSKVENNGFEVENNRLRLLWEDLVL